MPEYKTTAKGVEAPFVRRTASPVVILGTEYTIYFTKGVGDKGWHAFISADLESAEMNASGKTLDDAVNALKAYMESTAVDDMGADNATPENEEFGSDSEDTDTAPADPAPVESDTAPEPEGTTAKVIEAVMGSRDAYHAYTRGEVAKSDAQGTADAARSVVATMKEAEFGSAAEQRLHTYGARLAGHYCARTGGDGTVLTDAQRSRAWKKFRKVSGELMAA